MKSISSNIVKFYLECLSCRLTSYNLTHLLLVRVQSVKMFKVKQCLLLMFLGLGILAQCQSKKQIQPKINGVSFVASRDTIAQKHIDPVLNVNANYVSIMPFAFMRNLDSTSLYYNNDRQWYGERYEGAKQSIEMMHNNKISVMLKPQIWIGGGDFTGFIEMKSEEDWQTFEDNYAEMILLFAQLAEETQTEIYCIGTELNNFVVQRPAFWKSLIKKVRAIYSGQLTYAENWDKIETVPFWSDLDYIGVDAYFPISEQKTPSLDEVKNAWKPISGDLQTLSEIHNRQILFTEFGYRSIDYAGKEPWDSTRIEGQVNQEAQAVLLQGLMESVWDKDWYAGGFLWKWFHEPEKLSNWQANRFCVHGKKAKDTVKQFYKIGIK